MIAVSEGNMSEDMMNTKDVAAYLGINEKQVYALIKAGRIPGTRVTGKWVFPKKTQYRPFDRNPHRLFRRKMRR